jgi:hypothetical protein
MVFLQQCCSCHFELHYTCARFLSHIRPQPYGLGLKGQFTLSNLLVRGKNGRGKEALDCRGPEPLNSRWRTSRWTPAGNTSRSAGAIPGRFRFRKSPLAPSDGPKKKTFARGHWEKVSSTINISCALYTTSGESYSYNLMSVGWFL